MYNRYFTSQYFIPVTSFNNSNWIFHAYTTFLWITTNSIAYDKITDLICCVRTQMRDDMGVESVLDEGGVEEGEDAEELVQRLLRVHVRGGVQVAVAAARGQPRSAVGWGYYLIADVFSSLIL